MSIGKRIAEAIDKLTAGDSEGALIPAMIAVDATANKTYRNIKGNNQRFKTFVHRNLDVITRFTDIGILIDGGEFRLNYTSPRLKPTPDGCHPIQDILYQVRCDLLHEAEMPSNTQLTDRLALGGSNPFLLPASIVYGLIAAVVVAPVNRLLHIPRQYMFNAFGTSAKMDGFCGEKADLLSWFEAARTSQGQPAGG